MKSHHKLFWKWSRVILTMRRIDAQVYGHRGDALIGPCDTVSLCLDLLPDLIEIYELFAFTVKELSKFWLWERKE